MSAEALTLDVAGQDVTFTDPGKARASARRWRRMAAELDGSSAPDVTEKQRELRARAKAAEDWARSREDRADLRAVPDNKRAAAPAAQPAGKPRSPSPERRRAAAALTATGVRRARTTASKTRKQTRKAVRRYEAAGGAPVATSAGEFAFFFFGSVVALVLLSDLLGSRGSSAFAGATGTIAALAHRVIAPVPLVGSGSAAAATKTTKTTTTKGG